MRSFTKKLFISLALIICVLNMNAQVSLVQRAIDKIETSKNFSFHSREIVKSSFNPNPMDFDKESVFVRMPNDKNFGYFFKIKSNQSQFVYAGQNVVTDLNYQDSSYHFIEPERFAMSLTGYINEVKPKLNWPDLFRQGSDTTINAVTCYHLIETTVDSNVNMNGDYSYTHWFIGKQSNNILATIYTWRMTDASNNVISNYHETNYSDFKFNRDDVEVPSLEVPPNFHLKKKNKPLEIGTSAPDWTLYSTDGNKLSLSDLKGKVVLIEFSYVGCLPCMQAIGPVNNLHEKYKNVEILSIYPIDESASVSNYVKKYGIKFPVYIDSNSLPAKYQITGYPCFYFIDKNGNIAKIVTGFTEGFETEASLIIDDLLNM